MIPQIHAVQFGQLVRANHTALCAAWLQRAGTPSVPAHCERFLQAFAAAADDPQAGSIDDRAWRAMRDVLDDMSAALAGRGATAAASVGFVFAVKQPLSGLLQAHLAARPDALAAALRAVDAWVDQLGLYVLDGFQRSREQIIARQQRELLELSTPVISLWEGVLALPLIGTLDSARAQVVMENLLDRIAATHVHTAIIDITGVPTVDTMVAQHLMKTIAAARLMGADCILSGIRPQIAQTIVHLGVDLAGVVTKASLADAFLHATRAAAD
ncbi:anti-anti-sigma factor [Massilia phosphatilytica]|nr:anti-anti-sigma factor [Massilia phosphatilytica]